MATMPDMDVKLKVTTEFADMTVIRPGDTLVIAMAGRVDTATAGRVRERVMATLPDVADVLIVAAQQLAVYRPDEIQLADDASR